MVVQRKFRFIEHLKYLFHHSENTSFFKKINIGRESTSSQWLIFFREMWLCKLLYKGAETY